MNYPALLHREKTAIVPGRLCATLLLLLFLPALAVAQVTTPQTTEQQQMQQQMQQQGQVPQVRGGAYYTPERPKVNIMNTPWDLQQPIVQPPNVEQPAVEEPDIEFQEFVASSLGYRLPIFGQNLFQNVPSTFAPLDYAPVTPEYLVGPGDELLLRGWGQIDITNYRAIVDRTGAIYVPTVGTINVAGVRYDRLDQYLKQAISRYYKNFDLDVTLGRLRSIQVFVVGQVKRPGLYTVSSLSTLVNALFASGGPAKRGSMRNIQLKRGGQIISTFDFYDLLVSGDKSKDAQLMPGDVIYVPTVGRLVALAGSINVPAIFELKDHDSLGDVLSYAGGLTSTAAGSQAIIERIDARQQRKEDQFPLTAEGYKRELQDGDVLRFLHISPRFENAVTLRGNVAVPGRFPWREGMRVKDLIPNREFLVTEEYWKRQNRLGLNPSAESFQLEDEMVPPVPPTPAAPPTAAAAAQSAQASQAGTSPKIQTGVLGDQNLAERVGRTEATRMKQEELKNQIKRSAAEINWEYAVIQRLDPNKLTSHLLPFNLGRAIEGDESHNLPLQSGDVITIFSQADMQVPIAQQSKFVRLEGEFGSAGIYQTEAGETLRHLVQRVGGITSHAYLFGSEFTRESVRENLQHQLDSYVGGLQREIAALPTVTPEQQARQASQQQLVDRMRQLRSTGRMVLQIKPDATSADAFPELALEDGDRLFLPFRPSTVSVVGAVYNSTAFIYRPGFTVGDYLRQAGGVTRDGDKRHMFVLRANGAAVSHQQHSGLLVNSFGNLRLMPGDTVVVPQRGPRGEALRGLLTWGQLFQQFALGAAGLATVLP